MSGADIATLKLRYRIPTAWLDLGLPGEPSNNCRSPFRPDNHPSFSVFADDTRWSDFATGERGDVIDFVAKARSFDTSEAVRFVQDRIGVSRNASKDRRPWPQLRLSTADELLALQNQRGFSAAALRDAQHRGFLHFGAVWGFGFWAITDRRRALIELRRISGECWPAFGRIPTRKAHCIGRGKNWPVGLEETEAFPIIALCEGAPDFLALLSIAHAEGKANTVAPAAVLGGGITKLAPDALHHFRGKHVRIFPHADAVGHKPVVAWARQIADAGAAKLDAFDLTGLVRQDGQPGKDLADLCVIDSECIERHPKFREVLP
jgi:hypothetical protein